MSHCEPHSDNRPDRAEIQRLFAAQSAQQWHTRQSTAATRCARLQALKETLQRSEDAVCAALYADLRKPRRAAKNDLHICYAELDQAIAELAQWMQPRTVPTSPLFAAGRAQVVAEARGIVLLFGPWNFPFHLVIQPLVAIIAAGNCAIVKPNELAPATSRLLAELLRATFDEAEVAVVEGGVDLAEDLLALPFNHIFFTGSPAVGKHIMRAAANHLASVTLELGGKNPVVLDRSADIAAAATKIALYRVMNCGQLCLCPENIWVPAEHRAEFMAVVQAVWARSFYQDGQLNGDATGKLIDARNFARVTGYIDDAVSKGATLVCGGGSDADARTLEPTLLTDLPAHARIVQEEVFGPILSVFGYTELDEVIAHLQQQPKPLALYLFSREQAFIDRMLRSTASGGVTVNDCIMHCVEHNLPFGGVNHSGMGRYHGEHGFRELSHERAVLYPVALGD